VVFGSGVGRGIEFGRTHPPTSPAASQARRKEGRLASGGTPAITIPSSGGEEV
jgi:hypothetical protein